MSRVLKHLEGEGIRRAQRLHSPGEAAGDHCGHWVPLVKQQREGFPEKWDSSRIEYKPCDLKDVSYLIIGDEVISAHSLDLRRAEHPANVINDLNIGRGCLYGKLVNKDLEL